MNPLSVNPVIAIATARAARGQGSPRRPARTVRAARIRRRTAPTER